MQTADLCDLYYEKLAVCETPFKSYGGKHQFSGKITTVKIHENNNERFMETIETAEPGSVIVLDGVPTEPCAWMGDRKAGIAASRGIEGIIINGLVRDIEGLAALDIGVLALGTHPCPSRHTANRQKHGERDVVLDFGNIDWTPGHYVYADSDGVVLTEKKLD